MVGMKRDCGGAAGILGAFYTAVKLVGRVRAVLVVCASSITCLSVRLPESLVLCVSPSPTICQRCPHLQ